MNSDYCVNCSKINVYGETLIEFEQEVTIRE